MRSSSHRRALIITSSLLAAVIVVAAGLFVVPRLSGSDGQEATPSPSDGVGLGTAMDARRDRFVVTYAEGTKAAEVIEAAQAYGTDVVDSRPSEDREALNAAAQGASVAVEAVTAHAGGVASVALSQALTPEQITEFTAALEGTDGIEAVEPELHMTTLSDSEDNVPDDEYFDRQWDLTSQAYGINATNAWSASTGQGVTVAVIDTGILPDHPDLAGQVLPGYDFISDSWTARDDTGRDEDPIDMGDYATAVECGDGYEDRPSSWHGTHVAGTIAASTNNSIGVAGVAPGARILPVRALGRCGGTSTDIIDALTWASGGEVNGVPTNPNPAQVINLSLGGVGLCPTYYQKAIDAAVARGSIIVAAAGNEDTDIAEVSPAGCDNVLTVGASDTTGNRAYYSNYGTGVDLSAPGGDIEADEGILSLLDASPTTPAEPAYGWMEGTSQAAPHVAGTIALLLSLDPEMTGDEVTTLLQQSAQPMAGCDRDGCGAGVVDAAAAVEAAQADDGAVTEPEDDTGASRHFYRCRDACK